MPILTDSLLNEKNRSDAELFDYALREFPTLTSFSRMKGINELQDKTRDKPEDRTFKNLNIILKRISNELQ